MNNFNSIIGKSPAWESLLRSAQIISATDVTILLKGETGTGKEVLAKAIQKNSPRANKPFVTLNCAALPEGLVESEIFGHKRGAFTGALTDKQGLFQAADGGTLFLDEINSLPLNIQSKILRFLESGECIAVGSLKPYKVDVRVIAATNIDLNDLIAVGQFRSDLYFRLNVIPLDLPRLQDRKEDIPLLAEHFVEHFASQHNLTAPIFSKQSYKFLAAYSWPGNVRELRNLCERLSILLAGRIIEPENLPHEFNQITPKSVVQDYVLPELGIELEALEANFINQALARTNGNRSKSARLLGISRDTLLYRIQKHGLVVN